MHQDLSSFISSFQQENPNLFDFVHQTVHQVEQTCTEENSKPNRISTTPRNLGRESSAGIVDAVSTQSKSQNMTRHYSTEASSGTTVLYSFHHIKSLVESVENLLELEKSCSTMASFVERQKKNPKRILKELLFSRESSEKLEVSEIQRSNSKKDRFPFFVLNIKPIKLSESTNIIKKNEILKHSPIFQPTSARSMELSFENLNHSLAECAPSSLTRFAYSESPELLHEDGKILFDLDLDEHILEQNFLQNIRIIEHWCSSRKEAFLEIIEYIYSNKNLREDAHKNHPRMEVIYSTEILAQDLLKHLSVLIETLNKEDVKTQMKIVNDKKFLETHFLRFLRMSGANPENFKGSKVKVSIDEAEVRAIYDRIMKISGNLYNKSKSKESLRKNIHYLQKLIEKFPSVHVNSSDRVSVDTEIEIKYITVRKLIEKASEAVDTLIAEKLKRITILTYDHFMKPLSLLLLLVEKYYTPHPFMMTPEEYLRFKEHHSNTRRKRIIEILNFWMEYRSTDFVANSDLLGLLIIFLDSIFKFEKEHANKKDFLEVYEKAEHLIQRSNSSCKKALVKPAVRKAVRINTTFNFRPKFNALTRKYLHTDDNSRQNKDENTPDLNNVRSIQNFSDIPMKRVMSNSFCGQSNFSLKMRRCDDISMFLTWETEEIVQQLALIESKMFQKVQITHMMLMRWSKPAFAEECKEVYNVINRFNTFSFWVQYTVIRAFGLRKPLLDKFISLAYESYQIQNYASAHSIFTALLRLQHTKLWNISKDKEEIWETLQKIFTSATFFQDMENILRTANPPAVPSIPFFTNRFFRLQDNVAFQIKLEHPRKYLKSIQLCQLADYCTLMGKFQSNSYGFYKIPEVYWFLKKEYKTQEEIDFNHCDTEKILRTRILDEEENA